MTVRALCWGFRDLGSQYYYFIAITTVIIIIFKAIIKAWFPFCCPWMCPWLSILISRHPATACLTFQEGSSGTGLGSKQFTLAWPHPHREGVPSHKSPPSQSGMLAPTNRLVPMSSGML